MADDTIDLPPGFRFHPTDEEIVTHYLSPKVINPSFTATAIGDVDLNRCEPWDLPSKAKMGEKEWYFFCQRDRKYPTGMRTNRATEAGYWKATGKDKEIFRGKGVLVGMKKTLVFYRGRAPRGEKSNWVMHEFRLEGKASYTNLPRTAKDEWVVCRVFHKSMGAKKSPMLETSRMNSFGNEKVIMDSPNLPPLMEPNSFFNPDVIVGEAAGGFRGIPTGSSSIASYFSTMEDQIGQLQDSNKSFFLPNMSFSNMMNHECNTPPSSSAYYPQLSPQIPNFPLAGDQPAALGNMHQDPAMLRALASTSDALGAAAAIRRHCKAEQFSGQSMVSASQDTGLSTDHNTEISSKNMGSSYDHDLDDPTSVGQAIDLENLWKY